MKYTDEELESIIDRVKGFFDDYDKADDEFRRNQWHDHYCEKLGPYEAKMKALNGDDFDLYKESFDEYNNEYSDVESDEYIASLTANIDKLLDKLRNALGEEKVELESGPDGTEIVSHEDKGIEANDMTSDEKAKEKPEDKKMEDVLSNGEMSATEVLSSENAKTRYAARSASNKEKLKGWDPQKGLLRSDEECKEKAKETPNKVDDVIVEALTETPEVTGKDEYKEFMDDLEKYSK